MKVLAVFLSCFLFISCNSQKEHTRLSDIQRIEQDLSVITKTEKSRNYKNIETLNYVASYIFKEFSKRCDTVFYQKFEVNGLEYKNVIGQINNNSEKDKIVIGAHYDVAGDQEGADDNASGITGLLELSRILSKHPVDQKIELIAYTLEEPPFFRTEKMGSYVHAKSLYDKQEPIQGMICLEMIGYFSDQENSQDYPLEGLKLIYGNKGNFITVVEKFDSGSFEKKIRKGMKKANLINTKSFKGPEAMSGIDFSDHLNYWKFNYGAVMITNTAFYRNKNYHKETDTMEKLDLDRMSLVIDEVYLGLKSLE